MKMLLLYLSLSLIVLSVAEEARECPASEINILCNGIQSNDYSSVSRFMGEWGDSSGILNAGLCGGISPLSLAAALGHEDIVEMLLMIDGAVDVNFNDGGTALMHAANEGNNDVVHILLKAKNIDVNLAETTTGGTALQAAALNGHLNIVRQLLNVSNINVNSQSNDGYSALMMAARGGHNEIVDLLLDTESVDATLVDGKGDTVLTSTLVANNPDIASSIANSAKPINVDSKNNDGFTALMISALLGHSAIVADILRRDVNVDVKGNDNWNALLYAVAKGHADIVRQLLSVEGIDIDAECAQGWTALSLATHLQHSDIIDLLESFETAF